MAVSDLKTKAKEALKRKRYELAIEAFQEYLSFQADDNEAMDGFLQAALKARELRGKSLFGGMLSKVSVSATKDPKKRMASCLRVLAKKPDDKNTLMLLGAAAMEAGAFGTGSVAYRAAAEADPEDAEPWKRLGDAYGRRGQIQEALDALSTAIRINGRDQEAIKLRKNLAAEGALKISGYETAQSSRDLIKDKKVAEELETEQRMQLTPEHAASEIEKVQAEVEAEPDNPRIHVRLGDLLLQKGQEDEAVTVFQKALDLDPTNYDLSVRIGDLKLRRLKAVYNEANESRKLNEGDAAAAEAFTTAKAALLEASLEEYGRRVKEHPLDLAERFRLALCLYDSGKVDEALAEFQQTVRDPNRKVDSLVYQARCFEKKNIINLAVKKLDEAIESFPTLASPKAKDVYYTYADLLERQGDKAKAREVFERIVEEDAGYRDALTRLGALS